MVVGEDKGFRWCLKDISFFLFLFFFFQAEDGIRDYKVTGVQTCALPILKRGGAAAARIGKYKKWGAAATRNGQYKKLGRCRNENRAV